MAVGSVSFARVGYDWLGPLDLIVTRPLGGRLVVVEHGQPEARTEQVVRAEPVSVVARTRRSRVGRTKMPLDEEVATGSERRREVGEPIEGVIEAHRDQLVVRGRKLVRRRVGVYRGDRVGYVALASPLTDGREALTRRVQGVDIVSDRGEVHRVAASPRRDVECAAVGNRRLVRAQHG